MGKGGFTIVDSFTGAKSNATDWLDDFTLPDHYPNNLLTFVHINFSLSESTKIKFIKNGTAYPLNNDNPIIGEGFRSLPIKKGDIINFQCDTSQTNLQTTLALEQ